MTTESNLYELIEFLERTMSRYDSDYISVSLRHDDNFITISVAADDEELDKD